MNDAPTPNRERSGFYLRKWVKDRNNPVARAVFAAGMLARRAQVPFFRPIHRPLYLLDRSLRNAVASALSSIWYTPLLQSCLVRPAPGLKAWNSIPLIIGSLEIEIGSNCVFYGRANLMGRSAGSVQPVLKIGDNCVIGYQSTIAVGRRVEIGNNVLLASNCDLVGYPGHPLDPVARAAGMPELDTQVGDIVIEDDVWLGGNVKVLAGVRIGRGTIVGAGSVVTKDLPPFVVAAGVPARPVKSLAEFDPSRAHDRARIGERFGAGPGAGTSAAA
jgi:acetyltransferase-like isoleucine patch superfamily enzyme